MEEKPLILIADDERDIVAMLKSYFELKGYLVATAFDGAQVLERVARQRPDAILLDVNMPALDGMEACRAIRDSVSCPIGARVAAHLARDRRRQVASTVRIDERLSIDFGRRAVLADGEEVSLTRKEYEICELLVKHPNQTFDRDRIYELVWKEPGDGSVVTEHIRRLRRALADAGGEKDRIKTVWGVGYRWQA